MKKRAMDEESRTEIRSAPPLTLPFGDAVIVIVSDGLIDVGSPSSVFDGVSKEQIESRLHLEAALKAFESWPVVTKRGKNGAAELVRAPNRITSLDVDGASEPPPASAIVLSAWRRNVRSAAA
jgi:hypothetical protein